MRKFSMLKLAPLALVASPLLAQQGVGNSGINVAGETATDRAPIFTSSAATVARHRYGFDVQGVTARTSMEQDGVKLTGAGSAAVASAYYGVTSRVTLGAYLPYTTLSAKLEGAGAGFDFDESESGLGNAGVFGRMGLFQSKSGTTRIALNAGVELATGDSMVSNTDGSQNVGAAISHRRGRMTFHVAPSMGFQKDYDATTNLDVAGVFAASPKLGVSVEALSAFGGAVSNDATDKGQKDIDLGAGLRYRFMDRLSMDGGFRYNVSTRTEDGAPTPKTMGAVFGLHWMF